MFSFKDDINDEFLGEDGLEQCDYEIVDEEEELRKMLEADEKIPSTNAFLCLLILLLSLLCEM